MFILLDTGTLSDLVNPNNRSPKTIAITQWALGHLARGVKVRVPEIADYETRRNLILETSSRDNVRAALAKAAIVKLDALKSTFGYIELTTPSINKAAELWADVRKVGLMTAPPEALDGDAILAAQAIITSEGREQVIIASDNLGHLNRFDTPTTTAMRWTDIT